MENHDRQCVKHRGVRKTLGDGGRWKDGGMKEADEGVL